MSATSPQEFRELVRSQTDIVSLIGEAISLQPRHGGRMHVGLCPFHDDHNPSLNVYPDRQTFRCWSCNTGGDCFTFLMEREKLTFPEALEVLARRAGLQMPKRITGRTPDEETSRARLFEVLLWAENEFHQALTRSPAGEAARAYLHSRGIDDVVIREYRLGYHPEDWSWIVGRAQGKYPTRLLAEARLIGEKNGRPFDYFVNRVLFPIRNERGQPVSFGGRILPGSQDQAKYFNGLESAVFHKSRLLYGIDRARDSLRREGEALVVEGYTACIACQRHGFPNTVATLGTALTDQHVLALKRFAPRVVLVFDGDEAGQRAASRAVERFLAQDMDLRVLSLPEGLDPDDFLRTRPSEELRQLIDSAPEAWEFSFRTLRKEHSLDSVDGRQRILDGMLELVQQSPGLTGIRESLLFAKLAQRVGVPEQTVRERQSELRQRGEMRIRRDDAAAPQTPRTVAARRILQGRMTRDDRLECDLLEQILAAPEYVHFAALAGVAGTMRNVILREILDLCLQEADAAGELTLSGLLARAEEGGQKNLIVWIDEQARGKELARKIGDSGFDDDGCPVLLKHSLENFSWREAEELQASVTVQLSQNADGDLDEAMEARLRQAAEHHQRRATKRNNA